MMAAGRAAERARGEKRDIRIVILEKNVGLGAKLLLTGGGRCNLTNAEPDTRTFLSRYKEDGKFLFSAFAQHGVTETLELFHRLGLDTKVEEGNRVFPVTEKAKSVLDALVKYMTHGDRSGLDSGIGQHSSHETKGGAEAVSMIVRSSSEVTGFIQSKPGQIDSVKLKDGETISARSFILATGGNSHPETGSTGDGLAWLAKAGHTVSPPRRPSSPSASATPGSKTSRESPSRTRSSRYTRTGSRSGPLLAGSGADRENAEARSSSLISACPVRRY